MDSKRKITFENQKSEKNGIMLLGKMRKPFTYLKGGKYVITKEQCIVLKSKAIPYSINRYYTIKSSL